MQTTTRIIAAVVDTHNLTLYKENGDTILIPQGDSRVRTIVDAAVPLLLSQGYADISIAPEEDNAYVQFEAVSNGAVKLFRIAKSRLLTLFKIHGGVEEVPAVIPMAIGSIPSATPATDHINSAGIYEVSEADEVAAAMESAHKRSAVEEIMQHAVSVSSPEFNEVGLAQQGNIVEENGSTIQTHSDGSEPDTVIAVVDGQIIPGMEKIKTQFSRAAKLGSTTGVDNFLRRLSKVIAIRSHSIEDLLKFMERGDLPIADDGSILIYKVLNRSGDRYVDCHTKKVEQWVGAYVCMDPSLVDHNRNNECSNGLHVARRGYVREFSGDVCVLAKLAPEDVIAVPSYDANKMRVCGYHIIRELTPEQFSLVKDNKPITDDPMGKILLGNTLRGLHTDRTHEVRITKSNGGGVIMKPLSKPAKVSVEAEAPVAEALANPGDGAKDEPVDPKGVVEQVEQLSRKDMAAKLLCDYLAEKPGAREALLALKKASKVSWEKLGIPDAAGLEKEVIGPETKVVIEATPVKEEAKVTAIQAVVAEEAGLSEGSPRERTQKLLAIGLTSVGVARAILKLKRQSKKSWLLLGVQDDQVEQILKLAGN